MQNTEKSWVKMLTKFLLGDSEGPHRNGVKCEGSGSVAGTIIQGDRLAFGLESR
jgi:hypothetical protein